MAVGLCMRGSGSTEERQMVRGNWVVKGGLARDVTFDLSFKGASAEQRARGSERKLFWKNAK